MWVLVHVTDSARPTDAFVTYPSSRTVRGIVAAAEGMAAPADEAVQDHVARRANELSRRRHRKAPGPRVKPLVFRRRARRAA